MHIKDLISDDKDPTKLSHTKLWSNVAHAVATIVFVKQAWAGTLDYDIWLIYLGIVGAQGVSQAFLARAAAKDGPVK
ncbi:hypothetical protein [Achromobacter sp. AGC39]